MSGLDSTGCRFLESASSSEGGSKSRKFDFSRVPLGDELGQLMSRIAARVAATEGRVRKRRASDQAIFDAALAALVCDLAHLALYMPAGCLRVDMSHRAYARACRPAPFLTENFPTLVRLLERADLITVATGYRSDFGSQQTTIRPTALFLEAVMACGVSWEDFGRDVDLLGPQVELRGEKRPQKIGGTVRMVAPLLPLPDAPEIARILAEMERINRWLSNADLRWAGDCQEDGVDLSLRHMKRIFNNGRLDHGGRLYGGFWQRCSSEDRFASLSIEGEQVASVDFAQSAVRQAYALVGRDVPSGDLYLVPGLEPYRREVKEIINALLAKTSPATRFPKGTRGRFPTSWKFSKVLQFIGRAHPNLVPLFGKGLGYKFMYQESQVLIRVLLELMDHGVVGLPLHDCVLVRRSKASIAKEVMERSFREVIGADGVVEVELPPEDATTALIGLTPGVCTPVLHIRGA